MVKEHFINYMPKSLAKYNLLYNETLTVSSKHGPTVLFNNIYVGWMKK
jgi:hypothetical protein